MNVQERTRVCVLLANGRAIRCVATAKYFTFTAAFVRQPRHNVGALVCLCACVRVRAVVSSRRRKSSGSDSPLRALACVYLRDSVDQSTSVW